MRFPVDHDYHIHSKLSSCSRDPEQSTAHILEYAKEHGYRQICLTDHFWDETVDGASRWYTPQNYDHVRQSLPLPQAEGIEFLFGVETEMTKDNILGISPDRYDAFDFIIVPISHFHMVGFTLSEEDAATVEGRANRFLAKLEAVLSMPLPFHKIGLAHMANDTIGGRDLTMYCQVLRQITGERLRALFTKAAALGVGIELNTSCLAFRSEEEAQAVTDFYTVAKECGCKFYIGTDAHHPAQLVGQKDVAQRFIDRLGLTEEDRFYIGR
jgi:histidinol phosphatase-like PHP family hydrolase